MPDIQTNAAVVCLDMGMAQLDETIQQSWAGMSAQERSNCSGAYSAWNTLKLAYDATTAVSVVRGGIAGLKSLVGVLRLNKSFSRFVIDGKVIYDKIKSSRLSAPIGRMGARMERYVEWGRLSGAGKVLTSKPSWLPNRVISGNFNNPKGLIGVYDKNIPGLGKIDDTKRVLNEIDFPLCSASNFTTTSREGFKMLNVPNDAADMWATYNKPWIEALTNNKADVVVLSDKSNDLLKYVLKSDGSGMFETLPNGEKILTGFGKEIDYMENLVKQGKYQWDELNGIYKYIRN